MKFLLLSVGSVVASSCNNKLPSLALACKTDYKALCSHVDRSNLVSVLACGKSHQADLSPVCLAEIQKDFPAVFACTEDLSTACPEFGQVSRGQWANDNDDDDDAGHRPSRPPHPPVDQFPATPQEPVLPPAGTQPPVAPQPNPVPEVGKEILPPTQPVEESSESYTDYFTWDYYIPEDAQASSSNMNALHSRSKPEDPKQCFTKNYAAFSAPCLNAIAEQWATVQTAKGVKDISAPSADEAYKMMAPPSIENPQWKKMHRPLIYAAVAFCLCTLLACLCCCCRRCKKRRAVRIVPSENLAEVALSSLPEDLPMAIPVPAPVTVRSQSPTYIPYTGQGLSAYVPLAQPVHV